MRLLWFLSGDISKASSRLQGYLISKELTKIGISSSIVYARRNVSGRDFAPFSTPIVHINLSGAIAIFQKLYGEHTDALIDWLRRCGATIVHVSCDLRLKNETWKKADLALATSAALARYYKEQSGPPVRTVFDPFEYSLDPEAAVNKRATEPLKVVWFGDESNWGALERWKRILESEYATRAELLTVSNHPFSTWQWSMEAQRRALAIADIGIVPVNDDPASRAKSANRLTQLLAMGAPAIVGNLESYREVRDQGIPVAIVSSDVEFRRALDRLLDADYRRKVASDGYRMTTDRFSPEMAARRWMKVLGIEAVTCNIACRLRGRMQAAVVGAILRAMILTASVRRRLWS